MFHITGEDDNRAIEDGGLTMNVPNVTLLPSTTLVSMMSENEGAHVIEYMSKQDDGSFITTDQLGINAIHSVIFNMLFMI